MAFFPAFRGSQPTKKDKRIAENRGQMGVILLRKKCKGLASGSVINVVGSKHFPKSKVVKWCLLTSDVFPVEEICLDDYFIELWGLDMKTVKSYSLSKVALSNDCYRPTAGLALIPVRPSKFSGLLNDRRTFPTKYYYEGGKSESCNNKQCFIVGSIECRKDSLTVEQFTLITERDDQGQLQHELRDVDGTCSFRSDKDLAIRSHLSPRGAVILIDDGPQATAIGILNFSKEGLISPVFLTPETLKGEVQLYFPTLDQASAGAIGSDGRTQVDASLIGKDLTTPKVKEKSNCEMTQQGQREDHEARLSRNANACGYRIREVDIPNDGNCLFHAVADQLKVLGVSGHTHKSLRNLAVQELESNMLSMDLAAVVENNDAAKYIQDMSRDKEWGGHPELVALSHALRRTIRVISSVVSDPRNAIQDIGNFDGLPIVLGHQHNHYRSLELQQFKKDDGQGPMKPPSAASLSRNIRSVVSGRSKQPLPRYPTGETGNPSQNYDVTTSSNDYSLPQKEEYLENINFLTTSLRKKCAEHDRVQQDSESNEQRQKFKRLHEEMAELRFNFKTIQEENEVLRTENSALRSKVNSQNTCAVCGNDSPSSTGSTVDAAKLFGSPTNSRQSDSGGSSEEDFEDALSEFGGSTLD